MDRWWHNEEVSRANREVHAREYVRAQRKAGNANARPHNRVRAGIDAYVLGAALRGNPVSVLPSNVYKGKLPTS